MAVLIDLLGFGIVFPILPFWVTEVIGESGFTYGLILATYSLMTLLFAPVWGLLSDKYGRRPIILFGLAMSSVGFMIMTLTAIFYIDNIGLLFLSRIAGGIGASAVLPTAQAYISDTTSPGPERTKGFALMGAAFGIGFALGPAFGSIFTFIGTLIISNSYGYWAPGLVAIFMTLINLIMARKNLPESIHRKVKSNYTTTNQMSLVSNLRESKSLLKIVSLVVIFSIVTVSVSTLESTVILFGNFVYGLTEVSAGILLLVFGVTGILVQGGFIKKTASKISDYKLLLSGLLILGLGFIGIPTLQSFTDNLFWIIIIGVGVFISLPTLNALLSKVTPSENQGSVLGINQSMAALMRIIGPIVGTGLFEVVPSSPYHFVVILILGSLILFTLMVRTNVTNTHGQQNVVHGTD